MGSAALSIPAGGKRTSLVGREQAGGRGGGGRACPRHLGGWVGVVRFQSVVGEARREGGAPAPCRLSGCPPAGVTWRPTPRQSPSPRLCSRTRGAVGQTRVCPGRALARRERRGGKGGGEGRRGRRGESSLAVARVSRWHHRAESHSALADITRQRPRAAARGEKQARTCTGDAARPPPPARRQHRSRASSMGTRAAHLQAARRWTFLRAWR